MKFLIILCICIISLSSCKPRCLSSQDIILPHLPYNYTDLEPIISEKIMLLHHTKHHQAYVNNYNNARKALEEALETGDLITVENLQNTIKFNLGGHLNHAFFWVVLAPLGKGGALATGSKLLAKINEEWGSIDFMKKTFNQKAVAIQGSGWCWLGYDKVTKTLVIRETPNQNTLSMYGLEPIFGVDVWEHAYYLDYKNVRADYLTNIWIIVNWTQVELNYLKASNSQ